MDSSKKILIYGAGAIGRGFLPQILKPYGYEFSFVEKNKKIIDLMRSKKYFKAAIAGVNNYEFIKIPIKKCYEFGDNIDIGQYNLVFTCVGPNNCYELAEQLKKAKAVISCENDAFSAEKLRKLSGNPNIYFGIPDVITSNTAPNELIKIDPLTTVTERGILILEKGNYRLPQEIPQLDRKELDMHWNCKMFIHNTPHAIVAYLGWMRRYKYIHEAMADREIDKIATGAITELTKAIIISGLAEKNFAENYKDKELKRFRNKLLHDPIVRVAREPLRKLSKDNRLILGLRLCSFYNIIPHNIACGIKAALMYDNVNDGESQYIQNLRKSMDDCEVLKEISGIELLDPHNKFIFDKPMEKFNNR